MINSQLKQGGRILSGTPIRANINPSLILLIWVDTPLKINICQCFTLISHASNHINHLRPFHLKSAKGNHILLNSLFHICYRKLIYYLICHFVNLSNTNNHLTTYKVGDKRELNSLQISYHNFFLLDSIIWPPTAAVPRETCTWLIRELFTCTKLVITPLTQLFVLKLILSVYSSNSTN